MITQHISVPVNVTKVMIYYRLESPCSPSTPSCVEDLSLYVWETSTQSKTSAADTSNYHFIANITTAESVIELPPLTQSGLYLGIRDNGTCVSVSRVLVYYSVCEAGRQGLVRVEGNSSAGDTLPGTCVENSVSTSGSGPPLLQCLESGQWAVLSGCQCSPHFFLDNSRDLCLSESFCSRLHLWLVLLFVNHPHVKFNKNTHACMYLVLYLNVCLPLFFTAVVDG